MLERNIDADKKDEGLPIQKTTESEPVQMHRFAKLALRHWQRQTFNTHILRSLQAITKN